jgi:hypothetical protein
VIGLFKRTAVMQQDSYSTHRFYTGVTVLLALTQFACAAGSGNPATAAPLPDGVAIAANVLAVVIGLLVLIPRTRALGGLLAGWNMTASMLTNYEVDGIDYFLQVLAFDLASLALALLVLWRYRSDLRYTFRSTP